MLLNFMGLPLYFTMFSGLHPRNFESVNYVMVQCSVSFIFKSNWDFDTFKNHAIF